LAYSWLTGGPKEEGPVVTMDILEELDNNILFLSTGIVIHDSDNINRS
jgi:hypothetical protein